MITTDHKYIFRSGSWECEIWGKDIYFIDYRFDFCIVILNKASEVYNLSLVESRHGGNFQSILEKNLKQFVSKYMKGKKVLA
jgi:hypothetical protein